MTDVAEINKDCQYNGHNILVQRVNAESAGYHTDYNYEFELYIDDDILMTASELEQRGNPWGQTRWTVSLKAYAKAYIDGVEHE